MEGDSMEVGKTLYVATDEGMIPAPMGTHKMEDGSEVEVDEMGKVSKIKMTDLNYGEETDDAKKEKEQKKATANTPEMMAESEEMEVEMEDPIDWGMLAVSEHDAYELMAAHVLEMNNNDLTNKAIIVKLLVENFVLNLKLMESR
jgi:hypothetical protein